LFDVAPSNKGMIEMQKLVDLEKSIAVLLEQHRALKLSNRQLQQEKQRWLEEKQYLLKQIDRILAGLDDIDVEGI
jgi:hypothetical protein